MHIFLPSLKALKELFVFWHDFCSLSRRNQNQVYKYETRQHRGYHREHFSRN